ncbi:exodeoxyribonuclease V subunit alpha [Luteimonas fraxinea]|uniref:RecBCD enzyme subunit RecD n=1 Tax=Luteimonas fraxinea TaxID=2901869 RepID=A0ABS8UCY7_9GAMM|nr:exodeoxyribonuclease V subunit alpha [Luteimonas fraxinea]MCD9097371.1 exodeoxyribonuclease V subunit alpha [Luteimonas fraxinea]UHH11630.1 exodeoxyribonuclease V subunit alpha [Luteimonas fraxinea]
MTLLKSLRDAGALRTLDNALAQSLRRLDPATPDTVLAAAALASLAVANGHAGFDPAAPQRLVDADIDWPAPDTWRAALEASPWISQPDDGDIESIADTPLVFEHGLLYLRRYREYERRLALGLRRIGAQSPETDVTDALAPLFAQLFPDARTGADLQARAAAVALRHNLVLVTGGPGTGKTTTITRLLALLTAQAQQAGHPLPRIALAAPTGRAAERMAESVRKAVLLLAAAGVDAMLLDALPTAGTTLHRLLGTIPDSPRFRHHADNPLPFDVVVVDEASMIDLPLMAKLVEAVADGARLVLLGDPDQLPSVEAGDVLSGILRAAGDGTGSPIGDEAVSNFLFGEPAWRMSATLAAGASPTIDTRLPVKGDRATSAVDMDALQAVLSASLAAGPVTDQTRVSTPRSADHSATLHPSTTNYFPGRRIHLQRGYRQSAALDLAPLATAVREGDASNALSLLRAGELAGVHFHEGQSDPLAAHRAHLLAHWTALADTTDPAEALVLAGRMRILTAVREGPQGARGLNARIEELLGGSTRRGAGPGYFHGRLLLVTENSYRHRLFNGDIGICLADGNGAVMAWFPGDDPLHPRPFHPSALPAHDSAFAMTVHKAQGSEFDEVWLVLPERFNRVLSRELVYTGMTRARSALHIAARADVITEALARHASRWSGLGWRLGADDAPPAPAPVPIESEVPTQGALF